MAGKTGRTQNAERRTPNAEVKAGEHPLVLFTSEDGAVSVSATVERETVWLSQAQMAVLFDKERSVITKHIRNAIREGEVDEQQVCANFAHTAPDGKTYQVAFYNLDVIISVGYRVKSQRGVEFRRWATTVLRDYMLKGYALNRQRLKVLGQVVENGALLTEDGHKRLADHTLVALTILIAESKPAERETMLNLVMTFLAEDGQEGGHGRDARATPGRRTQNVECPTQK